MKLPQKGNQCKEQFSKKSKFQEDQCEIKISNVEEDTKNKESTQEISWKEVIREM